jgi:hypothetical protein
MKFTRKQVLEAIRYEPLAPAHFYDDFSATGGDRKVCAVGGLLRRAGVPVFQITDRAWKLLGGHGTPVSSEADLEDALDNKNYLQALSIKYESLEAKGYVDSDGIVRKRFKEGGLAIRRCLATFVKENFPKEFKTVG